MLVCTVLPTYNEKENIVPLIQRLLASVRPPYMVLVVDDDSPDGTWQAVEKMMARVNNVGVIRLALIRRQDERGLTSAIQRGVDEAIDAFGAEVVTWMDCDLSMPPEDVPRLLDAIEKGADVAVGSRWIPGGADEAHGPLPRTLSWIINRYAMTLLGDQVHDYTSGFIAARARVLRSLRLRGDYGEYCIDFLGRAVQHGYDVREVPYVCVPRIAGDSKTGVNPWDYFIKGRKYVTTVWQLRRGS